MFQALEYGYFLEDSFFSQPQGGRVIWFEWGTKVCRAPSVNQTLCWVLCVLVYLLLTTISWVIVHIHRGGKELKNVSKITKLASGRCFNNLKFQPLYHIFITSLIWCHKVNKFSSPDALDPFGVYSISMISAEGSFIKSLS